MATVVWCQSRSAGALNGKVVSRDVGLNQGRSPSMMFGRSKSHSKAAVWIIIHGKPEMRSVYILSQTRNGARNTAGTKWTQDNLIFTCESCRGTSQYSNVRKWDLKSIFLLLILLNYENSISVNWIMWLSILKRCKCPQRNGCGGKFHPGKAVLVVLTTNFPQIFGVKHIPTPFLVKK